MTSRRHIVFCTLVILAVCAFALSGQTRKQAAQAKQESVTTISPQEIFKRVSPSVFVVESLNSEGDVLALGSGVAVKLPTSDLLVVTNKHVVYGAVAYHIRKGKQTWKASLVRLDQGHDLCALKPEGGWTAEAVPVRVSSDVKVGERVYAIGAPEGLELTLSEGLVSGLREVDNARVIQTSAPVSHGSSGGGLFDSQGRLIGVTTFSLKEGQNLNFALPGEWVLALGNESAAHFPSSASGSQLEEAKKWADKGFSAYLGDRYQEAIDCYTEAVRLDPEDHTSWYRLGEAQQEVKRDTEAVKSFKQAVSLKNDDPLPWEGLAFSYLRMGKYQDAIDAGNEATAWDPHKLDAWGWLTAAYAAAGKYDDAIASAFMATLYAPDNASAWTMLAGAYYRAGKCTEALDAAQMILRFPADEKARTFYNLVETKCSSH
jgi:S1-C subfamily serine protease